MALTTLQISDRYDSSLIKTLTPVIAPDPWGTGPGDAPGTQTIIFDDARNDEVVAAINGYDASVLERAKIAHVESVAMLRKGTIINEFAFNGVPMKLDHETENALSKAYAALQRQPEGTTIDWEVSRGQFASFDLTAIAAISDAAFLHVQAAFTNQKRLTDLIHAAEDLDGLNEIDLESGWA